MTHAYTTKLGDIGPGRPFMMVNYKGPYIRVEADRDLKMLSGVFSEPYAFNDDGHHVPIVELSTGHLLHMSKDKPCFLYPGEETR